jgi:hypothetical protein
VPQHLNDERPGKGQEIVMDEKTKPVPETDKELTEQEIEEVTGGFNPQPTHPAGINARE